MRTITPKIDTRFRCLYHISKHKNTYIDVGISNSNIYAIRTMLATKYAKVFSKQKYTLSTAKKVNKSSIYNLLETKNR